MVDIIVNPKSLEKQIKMLEQRIIELQGEVQDLEKKREACFTLLGVPTPSIGSDAPATAEKKPEPKRPKRQASEEKIEEPVERAESLEVEAPSEPPALLS